MPRQDGSACVSTSIWAPLGREGRARLRAPPPSRPRRLARDGGALAVPEILMTSSVEHRRPFLEAPMGTGRGYTRAGTGTGLWSPSSNVYIRIQSSSV